MYAGASIVALLGAIAILLAKKKFTEFSDQYEATQAEKILFAMAFVTMFIEIYSRLK